MKTVNNYNNKALISVAWCVEESPHWCVLKVNSDYVSRENMDGLKNNIPLSWIIIITTDKRSLSYIYGFT